MCICGVAGIGGRHCQSGTSAAPEEEIHHRDYGACGTNRAGAETVFQKVQWQAGSSRTANAKEDKISIQGDHMDEIKGILLDNWADKVRYRST